MPKLFSALTYKKILAKFKSATKISIAEIAFAGIIIGLWIISARFLSFNLGFVRIGITFVWPMLIGLMYRPFYIIIFTITGDTLATLIDGGLGQWMIEYAIIPPGIALVVFALRRIFFTPKQAKMWWIWIIIINACSALAVLSLITVENYVDGVNLSGKLLSDTTTKIVIYVVFGLAFLTLIVLCLWLVKHPSKRLAQVIAVFSLVVIIHVVFIWLWGPIAQVRYFERFGVEGVNYWGEYNLYLVSRIIKTPITLALYTLIVAPIFIVYELVGAHHKRHYGW